MRPWVKRALTSLDESLQEPKSELNQLDWKYNLSNNKKRLLEHIQAFANYPGGGFLVFGVDSSGNLTKIDEPIIQSTIAQITNIARDGVEPKVAIDQAIVGYKGYRLLIVHIPESKIKPVHLRGAPLDNTQIRSGGTTRKASRQEVGALMLHSSVPRWEELPASQLLSDDEVISELDIEPILTMLGRPNPSTIDQKLQWLSEEKFAIQNPGGGWYVTNLGAISAAKDIGCFPDLSRKSVRVIVYQGTNKATTIQEKEGQFGYAIRFQGLMSFIISMLPQSEIIEKALRAQRTLYPEIALREILANALIHQDFSVSGASPLVEIYSNRIEISSPGELLPTKKLDRLIGTQPESRNESLARAFRRYKICEERGSGLLKAGLEIELYGLPPIQFQNGQNAFKVILHSPMSFADMSAQERVEACYQHAVLKYFSDQPMTNKSLRERLKMPERQRSMVSALIQEAVNKNRIKPYDPDNKSRKFAEYVPYWA